MSALFERKPGLYETIVLMYHGLDPGDGRYDKAPASERAYVLSHKTFRRHLHAIRESGCRVADPGGVPSPETGSFLPDRQALLTFDDGCASDRDVALPLLLETGGKALFFVTAEHVGQNGFLGTADLRELATSGMTIGSHGLTHRLFSSLSREAERREIEDSRKRLEDLCGADVRWLSLPGGRWGPDTLESAAGAGYRGIFTSEPLPARSSNGVWVIGRVAVRSNWALEQMSDLLQEPEQTMASLRSHYRVRRFLRGALGDRFYERLHGWWWSRRER